MKCDGQASQVYTHIAGECTQNSTFWLPNKKGIFSSAAFFVENIWQMNSYPEQLRVIRILFFIIIYR